MTNEDQKRVRLVRAKAIALTNSIRSLNDAQRKQSPAGRLGQDYNKMISNLRGLDAVFESLLPPQVEIATTESGRSYTRESFAELDAYAEQIVQMLADWPTAVDE